MRKGAESSALAELGQLRGEHPWLQQQGGWGPSSSNIEADRTMLFDSISSVKCTVSDLSQQVHVLTDTLPKQGRRLLLWLEQFAIMKCVGC